MKRILVVDDSSTIRKQLKRELEQVGYEIKTSESGEEALKIIPRYNPDLVTLDVEMPGLSGYDTCREIRFNGDEYGIKEKIPIILVTSKDSIEEREKGFFVGASDFITKPIIAGEVAKAVNNLIQPQDRMEGLTVLLVDDSKAARYIISSCLQEYGIRVILAKNGMEAIAKAKEVTSEIDMAILDFRMPEMNGDELCKILINDVGLKEIPIIFISGAAEKSDILELFNAGATDYLIKPFIKEELISRMKIHLRHAQMTKELHQKVMELKRLSILKDDFLSVASHDLRSPLNGILGFSQLLLMEESVTDDTKEMVEGIMKAGETLLDLINDLLDLSRIQSENIDLDIKSTNLVDIVSSSINILQHMARPKGIALDLDTESLNMPMVYGDKNALLQIINNLLSNAIKFTPNDGTVQVRFSFDDIYVQFEVQDSGIGIPEEELTKIFDKFSKISRSGTQGEKGTGLGMSIVKKLVYFHNGTISVKSKVDDGTCFIVRIPRVK